jgi:hypothetical protein
VEHQRDQQRTPANAIAKLASTKTSAIRKSIKPDCLQRLKITGITVREDTAAYNSQNDARSASIPPGVIPLALTRLRE